MANCDAAAAGNQTLDPLQSIIDASEKKVNTLETQARDILPFVNDFRSQGEAFDPNDISDSTAVNSALNQMTAEALCASSTDLEPINELVEDCLNEAAGAVKKYINDILGNLEDGIDLINDILALPESAMFKLLQRIWNLCDNIKDLVGGIDTKLQCVSLHSQGAAYIDQIQALEARVNTVTDDLHLADDGSFDVDTLVDGFEDGLKDNMNDYKKRADDLQGEIADEIQTAVDLPTSINPQRFF